MIIVFEEHNLIEQLPEIPYVPRKHRVLINDIPEHPGGEPMRQSKELPTGYYLEAHGSREAKKRDLEQLADLADVSATYSGK